ncbi:hypothetical protein DERF_011813 [Dermatophagoides farinae]|uniref:Uncharacterized protein n=1 Tax=Dermatophagoides farinae TaxID=6954 RepID=A0A922L552_DERFA|nr:hypothetical protein DERF_011813 [Dermatophagoides farinae]
MSLSTMLDKLNSERSPSSLSTYSNDSYHMQRGGYDRGRSPSPTEFFRAKIENYDHIWSREHELNEFIHNGIQKFLDKQAVRDLIHAYDLEDIFVHGEEHFFENVFEDFDNSKTMDELSLQKNQKGKFAQLIDVYNGQIFKVVNQSKNIKDKQQQKQQQIVAVHKTNRSFFILIELFGIKTRHLAHQRRESDQLNAMLENQSKENNQNQNGQLNLV